MSAAEELKHILQEMKTKENVEVCAVVSRSGIPLVYELPVGLHIEAFSTLSATILGASEVIYSEFGKKNPERIMIQSNDTNYVATSVGSKALLIAMSGMDSSELAKIVDKTANKIKEVLTHGA